MFIVSHDRYFMDRLANHLFLFENDGVIRDMNGNYTDYRLWLAEQEKAKRLQSSAPKGKNETVATTTPTEPAKKLTYKENLEFDTLSAEITKLEEEKAALEVRMSSGSMSHDEITEAALLFEKLTEEIEAKTWRLFELEERKMKS